jgi:hypothetical protein
MALGSKRRYNILSADEASTGTTGGEACLVFTFRLVLVLLIPTFKSI